MLSNLGRQVLHLSLFCPCFDGVWGYLSITNRRCSKPEGGRKADMVFLPPGSPNADKENYLFFFLCLFLRKRFLRLCVAILCLFLFFPQGITPNIFINEKLFYSLLHPRMQKRPPGSNLYGHSPTAVKELHLSLYV